MVGGGSVELDVGGREVSEASEASGRSSSEAEGISTLGGASSSSSSSSLSSQDAEASSAMKEGRFDFVLAGADFRRGAEVLVDLDVELDFEAAAGRGGLKVGGLRFGAGLDVVGSMIDCFRIDNSDSGQLNGQLEPV